MSYADFLAQKAAAAPRAGVTADRADLHDSLYPWQAEIVRWACEVGRAAIWADCVSADTVIDGPDGAMRIDALAHAARPFRVWSLDSRGHRTPAVAAFAFKKGRAPLYEVRLDDGRSIKVTEGHRFLTRRGWQLARDVAVGSVIAADDHSASRASAPRSTETAEDSTGRCATGCRRCGQRLLPETAAGQSPAPSLVDAHALADSRPHGGGPVRTPSRSHRRPGSAPPSMPDSNPRGLSASGGAGCRCAPSRPTPPAWTWTAALRSTQSGDQPQSTRESGQCVDRGVMVELRSILSVGQLDLRAHRAPASLSARPNWNTRTAPRSALHSTLLPSTFGPAPCADLTAMPSVAFRSVVSVQYIGVADYFDLHVPGFENYSAHGIWHHNTGLGKSRMQIEFARVMADADGIALVVAPLAVCAQTVREAAAINVAVRYVRSDADVTGPGVWITNYEMVERFDPSRLAAVVLDEASILKQSTGATRTLLIEHFAPVPYRLACTATPAPNDPEELTNQAAFLGQMTRANMLAAYFVHDQDGWRPKGHARGPMFKWMASWALAIRRPSDLGYGDDGYDLPGLEIVPHLLPVDVEAEGQLFATELGDVGGRAKIRKSTLVVRCERAAALVAAEPDEPWLIWCGLNSEAELLAKLIPGAVNVTGSMSPEAKATALLAFADGQTACLVTKAAIAAFGLNLQVCARMIFVGLSDSYESYYQAIRRCYRFGQLRVVVAHVVLSEIEAQIAVNIARKEHEASRVTAELVEAMRVHHAPERTAA